MSTRRAILLVLAATLAAPSSEAKKTPPRSLVARVPPAWRSPQPAATAPTAADTARTDVFGDPVLEDLIRQGLEGNKDLRLAALRIDEAAAKLGAARAELRPVVGGAATASRNDGPESVTPGAYNRFVLSSAISWEIDLWGRMRRASDAARESLLAEEASRRGVALTLVADIASAYVQLRALDEELAIVQRTLEARRESTGLIRRRFEGGIVSELDLRQAEIEEASTAANVPELQRAITRTENAISVLVGQPPMSIPRGTTSLSDALPLTIPPGLPSDLLTRRPDIAEAEHRVREAEAEVGVARALRFPTLSLTGALGFESSELSDLVDGGSRSTGLLGAFVGPLIDFGRNKRRVAAAKARADQAAVEWERTVLVSFREAEDALAGVRTGIDEIDARRRETEAARIAARLSSMRYEGGVTDYLEVLNAQRSLLRAETNVVLAAARQRLAVVELYRALGGGWSDDAPTPEPGG